MLSLINRFRVDESGATATEYAMLIVFVPSPWSSARRRLPPVSISCSRTSVLPSPASQFRPPKHRIRGRSEMDIPFPTRHPQLSLG